jgi:hypothetical protein
MFSVIIVLSVVRFLERSEPSASRDKQNQSKNTKCSESKMFIITIIDINIFENVRFQVLTVGV